MSGLKEGYLEKFTKGLVGEWKKFFVRLHNDGMFVWFKKRDDMNPKGIVSLRTVGNYLSFGSNCRAIPNTPQVPANNSIECMIAFPQEPIQRRKIHFFLASCQQEQNEWMSAILSTLAPIASYQSPGLSISTVPAGAYCNQYPPAAPVSVTVQRGIAPPAPVKVVYQTVPGQPLSYNAGCALPVQSVPQAQVFYTQQSGPTPQPQQPYPLPPAVAYNPPPAPQPQPYTYPPQPLQYPSAPPYAAQPPYPPQPYVTPPPYAPQEYHQKPHQ